MKLKPRCDYYFCVSLPFDDDEAKEKKHGFLGLVSTESLRSYLYTKEIKLKWNT